MSPPSSPSPPARSVQGYGQKAAGVGAYVYPGSGATCDTRAPGGGGGAEPMDTIAADGSLGVPLEAAAEEGPGGVEEDPDHEFGYSGESPGGEWRGGAGTGGRRRAGRGRGEGWAGEGCCWARMGPTLWHPGLLLLLLLLLGALPQRLQSLSLPHFSSNSLRLTPPTPPTRPPPPVSPPSPGGEVPTSEGPRIIDVGVPGPGAKVAFWRRAWRDKIIPALVKFDPDFIFICAGAWLQWWRWQRHGGRWQRHGGSLQNSPDCCSQV